MKYTPETYARAFWESNPDIGKFLKVIVRNGDWGGIRKIVSSITKSAVKKNGGRFVEVSFAREMPVAVIDSIKEKFDKKDKVDVKIDSSILAGVRITIDGEKELDISLQRKLNKLWPTK